MVSRQSTYIAEDLRGRDVGFNMKAARYHGQRDLRVEEIEVPQIRDGQVLVEIEWCGICGSDLHEYLVGKKVPRLDML